MERVYKQNYSRSKLNTRVLRRNLNKGPLKLKQNAFCSLVCSMLEYSCAVCDLNLEKVIQDIKKIQRKGARFVNQMNGKNPSVNTVMNEVKLDTLATRR